MATGLTVAPGTVTAIKPQVRDPERLSIHIDGSFAFGVARDVAEAHDIVTGQDLDAAALEAIQASESLARATNTALNFLAWRPRSEGEVRQLLRKDDVPISTVDRVIERLRAWRYLDDEDFARRWVENRATHRPRGARLLAQELRAKGIDGDVANEAIADADLDEYAAALEVGRKRHAQLSSLEPSVRDRRLTGFLGRRGFAYDTIRKVFEALRAEEAESGSS